MLSSKENYMLIPIIFQDKKLEDDAKLEHHEKCMGKIITYTKNNVKYKYYFGNMYLRHK